LGARHPVCAQFAGLMKELREGRLVARDGKVLPHDGKVMSFMELARRSGVSDERLRKVEVGDHGASLDSAARESEALGLQLDEALRIARLAAGCKGRNGGESGPQGPCQRYS
jgi:predicted transcriptional regulator